jgi:predicted phosphoribosyltransferase
MTIGRGIHFMSSAGRREAGQFVASRLGAFAVRRDAVVIAVSPGGLMVAGEIAAVLEAPLTVLVAPRVLRRGEVRCACAVDRDVILVDDGLSGSGPIRRVLSCVRGERPRRVLVVVPYIDRATFERLSAEADGVVSAIITEYIATVRALYDESPNAPPSWMLDLPVVDDDSVLVSQIRRSPLAR